jgi:DNA-directed RNA polymerase subunit RPC12/RpoP
MAGNTVISCPECKKKFKGREDLQGKKIRCPVCGQNFIVKAVAVDKASSPGSPPAPGSAPPATPASPPGAASLPGAKQAMGKATWTAEDEDSRPYDVTHLDLAPRCPHCANLMASDEAIICLHCGYNTQTREMGSVKKTIQHTGGERFLWLLPGLLCVVAIIIFVNVDLFYCLLLPDIVQGTAWAETVFATEASRFWMVIPTLFAMWTLGYFAYNRLIVHPIPPEKEKD